jgi:hypothetical protein
MNNLSEIQSLDIQSSILQKQLLVSLISLPTKYKILGTTGIPARSRLLDYNSDLYMILVNSIGDYFFGSEKTSLSVNDFNFRQPLHIEIFNQDRKTHKHDVNLLTDNHTINKIKFIDNPTARSVEIEIYKTYHITLLFHNNRNTKTNNEVKLLKKIVENNMLEYLNSETNYEINNNGKRFLQYLVTNNTTEDLNSLDWIIDNIYNFK